MSTYDEVDDVDVWLFKKTGASIGYTDEHIQVLWDEIQRLRLPISVGPGEPVNVTLEEENFRLRAILDAVMSMEGEEGMTDAKFSEKTLSLIIHGFSSPCATEQKTLTMESVKTFVKWAQELSAEGERLDINNQMFFMSLIIGRNLAAYLGDESLNEFVAQARLVESQMRDNE